MATESDVDISGAHPYWAYPFSDVAVVHNGQLTNYFQWKRRLERSGHRFQSECDSEIIAVYLAEKMSEAQRSRTRCARARGARRGVHLHLRHEGRSASRRTRWPRSRSCSTRPTNSRLASEEIAIRAILDHEIDTYDPYEGEVLVWQR